MENRSFDHMLGWMKKINPEINGVDGTQWNPLNISDPSSQKFFTNTQAQYVDPDPGHSFQAIREQIFGSEDTSKNPPPMNGFAQQAFSMDASINLSRDVMNGFEPDMVAVYKTLVSEFSVFDRYSYFFVGPRLSNLLHKDSVFNDFDVNILIFFYPKI
jgi:phospholipase C